MKVIASEYSDEYQDERLLIRYIEDENDDKDVIEKCHSLNNANDANDNNDANNANDANDIKDSNYAVAKISGCEGKGSDSKKACLNESLRNDFNELNEFNEFPETDLFEPLKTTLTDKYGQIVSIRGGISANKILKQTCLNPGIKMTKLKADQGNRKVARY